MAVKAKLTPGAIIKFINKFCYILSEEKGGFVKMPFKLRNYQERTIREMFDPLKMDQNILIEKTRQIGISWLMAGIFAYIILFIPNEQLRVLGKKEEFVDSSELDPNTLMGKVKFILENFESRALKAYTRKVIRCKYLKIVNRLMNTICTGESSSSKSGRGTTLGYVWWDETAFTEHDREIFASISPNSRRLILLSTANGKNTLFYQLKKKIDDRELIGRWHKIRIHWSEYFSQAWYEGQKQELGGDPLLIAQELDIDYEQSTRERIFYNFGEKVWRSDVSFKNNLRSYTVLAFDYGIRDYTSGVVIQYHPHNREFYITDAFELNNVPFRRVLDMITNYNSFSLEEITQKTHPKFHNAILRFFLNALKWKYAHVALTGDPAGASRGLADGISIEDVFFEYGLSYTAYRENTETVLSAIRGRVDKIFIDDSLESVKRVIQNWSYELDKQGNPTQPVHNDDSHLGKAIQYGFNYIFRTFEGGLKFEKPEEVDQTYGY